MQKGDLVHIPQSAVLLLENNQTLFSQDGPTYVNLKKPIKALFWEVDYKNPVWSTVYYKDKIWTVRTRNIYPISQGVENAS